MSKEDQRVRAHVYVEGSVQGVFFRAVFEGKRSDVEEMVGWCQKGPPGAIVSKVDVTREEPRGESGAFSIKYY
jgi:acylphosphatase